MLSPVSNKKMKRVTRPTIMSFRGESYIVKYTTWRCPVTGNQYEDEQMVNDNIQQLMDAYKKHHLPHALKITDQSEVK